MARHKEFAKVFQYDDIGQVVVLKENNEETYEPEIRLYFLPSGKYGALRELGVCQAKIICSVEEERDRVFDGICSTKARSAVVETLEIMQDMADNAEPAHEGWDAL